MKIAIVDDHAFVRSSIAQTLLSILNVVEEVAEADSAEDLFQNNPGKLFDLILLDYHIPGETPDDTFHFIKKNFSNSPVLYISSDEDPKIILDTIENGASGYVVKTADMELFVAAIDLVLAGGKYIPVNLMQQIRLTDDESEKLFTSNKLEILSKRQRDVFNLLLQQFSNKVIADKLNISESTVKSHVSAIFDALGVRSRREVINRFKENED